MLVDLQTLIRARGPISRRELARHFETDAETLTPMLDLLEQKGRVRQIQLCGGGCPGCSCASADDFTVYEAAGVES